MKCTEIMRIHLNDKSLCSLAQIYRKIKTFSSNQPQKHISSIVLWKRRQFTLASLLCLSLPNGFCRDYSHLAVGNIACVWETGDNVN